MDYFLGSSTNYSECSSECESGWTLYLDNSFIPPYDSKGRNGNNFVDGKCGFMSHEEEEEEEDLSMISDASSGPPHFPEDDQEYYVTMTDIDAPLDTKLCKNTSSKKQKFIESHCLKKKFIHDKSSLLDDTASSPAFDFNLSSKNFILPNNNHGSADQKVSDFSQGYSTTHFEEESCAYNQDKYGFFHSSLSGNYPQENQLSFC
ncbi:hypothetical protein ACH5RR_022275 [Cinchona calisaya]|uniref:Uncharacterized protein n=1 Tax=Cinchona calisaya TaxID=153742 RepID=A0ABD2ZCB5_9GENT